MTDQLQKDARFWDKIAEKYSKTKISDPEGYEVTLSAVREHLQPDHAVLELGCGTGSTALLLAESAGSYLGTDISPEMIRIAKEKASVTSLDHLSFEVRDADQARGSDGAYDRVLAFNLLHTVPDPARTIRAVHEQLKPGGLFISKTPCIKLMNPLIRAIIPIMKLVGKAPTVESFDPETLDAMIEAGGFEIVERGWHGRKGKDSRVYRVARKV